MLNKINVFFCFLIASFFASAQEVEIPLKTNAQLQQFRKTEVLTKRKAALDTIRQLPFIDDFSDTDVIPNFSRWIDRSVFINGSFPINPPTYGVATFDGLNEFGLAYRITNGLDHGPADSLTSQPIDLSGLLPSDSIYLSFFFQSKGRGDEPELRDSLILEFWDENAKWNQVLTLGGRPLANFRQLFVPVNEPKYLHEGFQFRFRNFASAPISGNVDHWHIDYVRLNKNRSVNDTIIEDISINQGPTTLLTSYTQMPYAHFLTDQTKFLSPLHTIRARNLFISRNTSYTFTATNLATGVPLFTQAPANFNFDGFSDTSVIYNTFNFPVEAVDSFTARINYVVRTAANDVNRANDTLIFDQKFENCYAHDDGSAEYGYGLNHATGQIAYKFRIAKPDTLVAVGIFFSQIRQDVGNQLFSLRIWKQIGEPNNPTTDQLLYEQPLLRPRNYDSINQYYIYRLDTPVVVSDSVYIGWVQGSNLLLNIGIDRNNNANNFMFFKVGANWQQSLIPGAWMMRPYFGKQIPFGVNTRNIPEQIALQIAPNPASDHFTILNWDPKWQHNSITVEIIDGLGRLVKSQKVVDNLIPITELAKGMYFVKVFETRNADKRYTGKFIKN